MAVQIRKLSDEEASQLFPKRGQMDLSDYKQALGSLRPGDAAEVEPGELSQRAVKRRWGQAAKQMGYSLKWARDTSGNGMRFQVREAQTRRSTDGRRTRRK